MDTDLQIDGRGRNGRIYIDLYMLIISYSLTFPQTRILYLKSILMLYPVTAGFFCNGCGVFQAGVQCPAPQKQNMLLTSAVFCGSEMVAGHTPLLGRGELCVCVCVCVCVCGYLCVHVCVWVTVGVGVWESKRKGVQV